MSYDYNKNLVHNSQKLRRDMTPEERHLWYDFLKVLPVTVNRQKVIGDFIVDFYIHTSKIVIEIDGSQHETRKNSALDERRDENLKSLGILVLRYSNDIVRKDFNYVCQDILSHLGLAFSDLKKS